MTVQRPILVIESFLDIFGYLLYDVLLSMCAEFVTSSCGFFQQPFCRRCLPAHDSADLVEFGVGGRSGGKVTRHPLYERLQARTFSDTGLIFHPKLPGLYGDVEVPTLT